MRVSVVCVIDAEECCVMIVLNWREMRVSVVCVIDDGEEMLCDDNSKLKKKCAFQLFVQSTMVKKCCVMIILNWREMRVSVVCVIDDGEEMLCDDNSKLERNARFSCLCNRRWWRNVLWW